MAGEKVSEARARRKLHGAEASRNLFRHRHVFVGGAPRSGTSLLQKMLSLHSAIFAGPEFDHLPRIMELYRRMGKGLETERQREFYSHEELRDAFRKFVGETLGRCAEKDRRVKVISEKTPDNVFVFDRLAELFPDALFILVIRDPRAVYHSLDGVRRRASQQGRPVPWKDMVGGLRWILHAVEADDYFVRQNPDKVFTVRYEDLVTRPEETVRRLCGFINVEFESDMLETERRNASSALLEATDGVWYTPEMYDRRVDASSKDAWKKQMPKWVQLVIEDQFARLGLDSLKPYGFTEGSAGVRLLSRVLGLVIYSRRVVRKTGGIMHAIRRRVRVREGRLQ